MKKFLFSLFALSIFTLSVNATDLFTSSKHVSWDDGGIDLEAAKFVNAKAGNKIVVTFTGATDGIEFKVMDNWDRLPGSLAKKEISGEGSVEQFLTPAAVARIKAGGLQIIGGNFIVTKVELLDGKDNVTDNTVWTGYFWMDSWSTLEIVKTSFAGVDWNKVKAIRFYSEANRTDYVINVLTSWETGGKLGDQSTMTMTNEYAELSLEGIDMAAKLAATDRLMIQCDKKEGAAFNFTAIELVMKGTTVNFSADLGQGNYVTTFSADYATKVPNGVTAYTAKVDGSVLNGSGLKLTKIDDGVVPANEGVLLRSNTNGEVIIPYVLSSKENDVNNLFVGTSDTDWEDKVTGKTVYVLARNTEINQIGFIKLGTGTVPANKAVLVDSSLGARSFSISFDDSELTSVQGISENSTVESAVRHNVLGQRVAADAKGIVIVNGKKVLNN